MKNRPGAGAAPILIIGSLGYVVLFIAAFSSPALQSLVAVLFFVIVIGVPLWLR